MAARSSVAFIGVVPQVEQADAVPRITVQTPIVTSFLTPLSFSMAAVLLAPHTARGLGPPSQRSSHILKARGNKAGNCQICISTFELCCGSPISNSSLIWRVRQICIVRFGRFGPIAPARVLPDLRWLRAMGREGPAKKAGSFLGEAMPSATVQSFTDAEAYARFVPSTQVELTIAKGGRFEARATLVALHDLWMQRFSDNLPRVAHSVARAGRVVISFRTSSGPSLVWGGLEMAPETILRHNEEFNSFQRSSGDAAWGSVSLPVSSIANIGSVMAGHDLAAPRNPVSVKPSLAAMWRLQKVHAEIGQRATSAPDLFTHAEVVRGMEQALLEALVSCLVTSESYRESTGRGRHGLLIRQLRALLESCPDKSIYMPELSAALGVSGRTLRNWCQEQLGMPLNRYLTLRRMYLARRALERADPAATRVTDVATEFGFWEFGRFAVAYKSTFGKSPSIDSTQELRPLPGHDVQP